MASSLAWLAATPKLWAGLLILAVLPAFVHDAYILQVLCLAMVWTIFASSWNLAVGYAGLKTFGHQAFFGLEAYVSALTSIHAGLSPWITLWIGAASASLVGALVGLPLLRIKSLPHLAIVTLAFAEIVRITCSNLVGLTRGELGLSGIAPFTPVPLPGGGQISFGPADRQASYVMIWTMMASTLLFLAWFVRSRTGLIVQSIRDSQTAAESLGVNLARTKLLVLAISGFIAGTAGGLYAHFVLVLTPTSAMGIALMVQMTAITLVGGIGTLQGPLIGALVLTVSSDGLRLAGDHRMLAFGALIILVVLFAPRGLARLDVLIADIKRRRAVQTDS